MIADPRPRLDALGVAWTQTVPPDYGYTGDYEPSCVYLHWTASARGSDTAAHAVATNCYHACVARSGLVHLGGWQMRQAHGGSGRQAPISIARAGAMQLDDLLAWQASAAGDDTDSWPNRYGVAVSIDNDGMGEIPLPIQWDAWVATAAVLLDCIGASGVGHLIDHAASTARKVDLATSPALLPAQWWPDIDYDLKRLRGTAPPTSRRPQRMWQYIVEDEAGHLFISDGMNLRWCRTQWDNDNVRAWLRKMGLTDTPMEVSRDSIRLGEWGVFIGDKPPW